MHTGISGARKVSREHLAFYRAHLQGIELREAARLYLQETNLWEAKRTVTWVRDTLVNTARRHGRLDYARLLRLRIAQEKDGEASQDIPSFEEYNEIRNRDGFYTQAELMQLYLEEYPEAAQESPRKARIRRLVERQLEAVNWAENHLATAPVPADSVAVWFEGRLAASLILAGIRSIGELGEIIRRKGYRWWRGVRGIGEKKGARIARWLGQYIDLGAHALQPIRSQNPAELVRPPHTAILPLESFLVPEKLNGEQGKNRSPARCLIAANRDNEAIEAWLSARARSPHTRRAYRREAERFILWAILERGKALSSLDVEDCSAYREWLGMLGRTPKEEWRWRIPQDAWIGRRGTPRWSPDWRPFEGKLDLPSQRQAYTILKAMFEWLVKVKYLDGNTWEGVAIPSQRTPDEKAPAVELERSLSRGQLEFLFRHLDSLPKTEASIRLGLILSLAYATGMRLAELVSAKTGHLYHKTRKSGLGVRWMLKVLGKGGKWRVVPMPSVVMARLREYFQCLGLPDPERCPPDTPLILSLGGKRPLGRNALYQLLKRFFADAARAIRVTHPEDADRIVRASTHWLRHSRGSHSAEHMPIHYLQRLLGHASLATTSIYTSADEEALYEALEKELGRLKGKV